MASRALSFAPAPVVSRTPVLVVDAALMLAAALVLRCWWFGNPLVQVDEQFYLVVGDRLLHGAVPFVDVWDRKPVGLFLAYAAIRLLGGNGILQYQLVATLLAAATALLVVRIARLHAGETAAQMAGVAALLWMLVLDGAGGQSPIFYNPLMAGAALLTFRAVLAAGAAPTRLFRAGCGAMLLVGMAMQFKYVAMFEGIGLGCLLLVAARDVGVAPTQIMAWFVGWVALAVLPTALAWAWYAYHGYAAAFVYANFQSIGARQPIALHSSLKRLALAALECSPLIAASILAVRRPTGDATANRARTLIAAWLAVALVGCLSIGVLDYHYLLPLVAPLAALAAPGLESRDDARGGVGTAALVLGCGAVLACGLGLYRVRQRGTEAQLAKLVAAIEPRRGGCLFVYGGDPILYQLTQACTVSRYLFPSHLNNRSEAAAIGVDPTRELVRILAARPELIVTTDLLPKRQNWRTWHLLQPRLARDYALLTAVPVGRYTRFLYQRRSAAAPMPGPDSGGRPHAAIAGQSEQFQLRGG